VAEASTKHERRVALEAYAEVWANTSEHLRATLDALDEAAGEAA
jgi:hypothetical protein